jgi:hypothetical protein
MDHAGDHEPRGLVFGIGDQNRIPDLQVPGHERGSLEQDAVGGGRPTSLFYLEGRDPHRIVGGRNEKLEPSGRQLGAFLLCA